MIIAGSIMRGYTTAQVAKLAGVSKITLLRWLYAGKVKEPKRQQLAGPAWRIWTDADVTRVKQYKAAHYRKGRGRKPKP